MVMTRPTIRLMTRHMVMTRPTIKAMTRRTMMMMDTIKEMGMTRVVGSKASLGNREQKFLFTGECWWYYGHIGKN
jgi:hypothetical protein